MMNKIAIINCFDTYEERVVNLARYFDMKKYKVTVLTSDYLHMAKKRVTEKKNGYEYIK